MSAIAIVPRAGFSSIDSGLTSRPASDAQAATNPSASVRTSTTSVVEQQTAEDPNLAMQVIGRLPLAFLLLYFAVALVFLGA